MLIKDGGKIRNCPNNKAKMSYWSVLKNFHGYKKYSSDLMCEAEEVGEALLLIGNFLMFVIIFPVSPLIGAFLDRRRAIKDVADFKDGV